MHQEQQAHRSVVQLRESVGQAPQADVTGADQQPAGDAMSRRIGANAAGLAMVMVLLTAGCASSAEPSRSSASAPPGRSLACPLSSNCVASADGGSMAPLRFEGSPQRAIDALRATLAEFPEATIVRSEGNELTAIFTTPLGFRDEVDFRVDATAQRIDFRSRSLLGLFDFGKNHRRMTEFAGRFEQKTRR